MLTIEFGISFCKYVSISVQVIGKMFHITFEVKYFDDNDDKQNLLGTYKKGTLSQFSSISFDGKWGICITKLAII